MQKELGTRNAQSMLEPFDYAKELRDPTTLDSNGSIQSDKHNLCGQLGGERKHKGPDDDSIDGEGGEASFANPGHEPGDRPVGHDKRNHESDGQNGPAMGIDLRDADGIGIFSA